MEAEMSAGLILRGDGGYAEDYEEHLFRCSFEAEGGGALPPHDDEGKAPGGAPIVGVLVVRHLPPNTGDDDSGCERCAQEAWEREHPEESDGEGGDDDGDDEHHAGEQAPPPAEDAHLEADYEDRVSGTGDYDAADLGPGGE